MGIAEVLSLLGGGGVAGSLIVSLALSELGLELALGD